MCGDILRISSDFIFLVMSFVVMFFRMSNALYSCVGAVLRYIYGEAVILFLRRSVFFFFFFFFCNSSVVIFVLKSML